MQRRQFGLTAAALMATGLSACATNPFNGWTTLLDGQSLDGWSAIGDANWRVLDGAVQADKGAGFLVSKDSYTDFQIRAEFWSDADANSGIFIRCADPKNVTADNSYEVNIFDKRPDPTYGTGAIVNVAKIGKMPEVAGQWNVYEITAQGPLMTVVLNGVQTVQGRDARLRSGPIALQRTAGLIKFRKLQIRAI
jgi:hypothetical protein